MLIGIYVDDLVICTNSENLLNNVKSHLNSEFDMTDLGNINYILGIEIKYENGSLTMTQERYANEILVKYGMQDCKPLSTPVNNDIDHENTKTLHENANNGEKTINFPYPSVVGSLMYLMVTTRPDLAYAVGYASRFMSSYTQENVVFVKRILRYIKGTLNYALNFEKTGENMSGYTDSDFAGSKMDRKSTIFSGQK